MTYGEYLAHHGILGMHWGVRRYQNKDGSLTEAGRRRYYNPDGTLTRAGKRWQNRQKSDDYKRYKELSKRNVKSLSTAEIEEVVKRRDLEDQFLNKPKSEGRKAAEAELARFGVKALTTALVATAAVAGFAYLKKKYNINAETITRKIVQGTTKVTKQVAKTAADEVSKVVKDAMPSIKKAATSALDTAGEKILKGAASAADATGGAIIKGAKTAARAATTGLASAADATGAAIIKGAKTATKAATTGLASAADATGGAIIKGATSAGKGIGAGLDRLGEAEIEAAKKIAGAGKAVLGKLKIRL